MRADFVERELWDRPDDVALWRVYGEWLTDRGDARGALIGLEQALARTRRGDRDGLERQIAAIVAEHEQDWDAELPDGVTAVARRHGFAAKISVQWSEEAPALIEPALRSRFVTGLRITQASADDDDDDAYGEDGEPAELPPLAGIGALATLNLSRLTELDLSYLRLGKLGADALAVAAVFRGDPSAAPVTSIENLDLRYCQLGDAGLAALTASPSFTGVRRLHLQSNGLTADGVRALHAFGRLTELDLRYNPIGAEGAAALLAAPFAGSLTRLLLYRGDVTDDGVRVLAGAPRLPPALRSYWRSV